MGNCTVGKLPPGEKPWDVATWKKAFWKIPFHQFLVIQIVSFSRLNSGIDVQIITHTTEIWEKKYFSRKNIFLDDSTKSFNFYNLNPVDLSYNFSYDTGNKDDIIWTTPSQFIRFLNLFRLLFYA